MKNIFKDMIDVKKYKRRYNTMENELNTLQAKYVKILEEKEDWKQKEKEQDFQIIELERRLNIIEKDLKPKKKVK